MVKGTARPLQSSNQSAIMPAAVGRVGKRKRKEKLAVSASNPPSLTPETSAILRKLHEDLKDHEKVHRGEGSDATLSQTDIRNTNESCKSLLRRLKTVLPTLAEQLLNPSLTTEKNVMRMCKIIIHLIHGDSCPHTTIMFGNGRAKRTIPTLFKLLALMSKPDFQQACPMLIRAAAELLNLMLTKDMNLPILFFADSVQLLQDLHFLAHAHSSGVSTLLVDDMDGAGAERSNENVFKRQRTKTTKRVFAQPYIECFECSAHQVTNELDNNMVFHPLKLKIDSTQALSFLRNAIMQLSIHVMPLIRQFLDSKQSLKEFWEVICYTVADSPSCTGATLRLNTLRVLRLLLRHNEERYARLRCVPSHLLMVMRLGTGTNHGGSMQDSPDSSPMPHFRTLIFDDILADCIKLACKIDVNGHAVEGNVIDGNRMQLLMSLFAPNGILEINVLQKNLKHTASSKLRNVLCDAVYLLYQSACGKDTPRGHWLVRALDPLLPFRVCPEPALDWGAQHMIYHGVSSTSSPINTVKLGIHGEDGLVVRSGKDDAIADALHAEKHPIASNPNGPREPMTPLSERPIFEFVYAVVQASRDKIAKEESGGRGVPKSQNLAFPNSPSEAIEPLTPRQAMYSSDGDNRIGHSSVSKFLYNDYGDSGKIHASSPWSKVQNQRHLSQDKKALQFLENIYQRLTQLGDARYSASTPTKDVCVPTSIDEINNLLSFAIININGKESLINFEDYARVFLVLSDRCDSLLKQCSPQNEESKSVEGSSATPSSNDRYWFLNSDRLIVFDPEGESGRKKQSVQIKLLQLGIVLCDNLQREGKSVDTASTESFAKVLPKCLSIVESASELFAEILPKCVSLVESAMLDYSSHYACELAIFAANRLPEFLRVFNTRGIGSRDLYIKSLFDAFMKLYDRVAKSRHMGPRESNGQKKKLRSSSKGDKFPLHSGDTDYFMMVDPSIISKVYSTIITLSKVGAIALKDMPMLPLWQKMYLENSYDEYNVDDVVALSLWNPIAVRHAIRAMVEVFANEEKSILSAQTDLLSSYVKSCWGPNRVLRESFAATVPVLLSNDGMLLEIIYNKGDKWENVKAFCSHFKISDANNISGNVRLSMITALGSLGQSCIRDIVRDQELNSCAASTSTRSQESLDTIFNEGERSLWTVVLEWVVILLLKTWCDSNYHSVKVECCHQIHRLSRSNGITTLKLFSTFRRKISEQIFPSLLCMALESDNLRIHLFASVFLRPEVGEFAPFLQNCMQYIVPELVILRNETALKCLTRIKTQQEMYELQLHEQEKKSNTKGSETSPVSNQATVASSQNDNSSVRNRSSSNFHNHGNSITGVTVSEEEHVSDILLEYSCPIVARVLTDMYWSNDGKQENNPFEFILNHVKRGFTINEYIDYSFFELVKELIWGLGADDENSADASLEALRVMSSILVKGASKRLKTTRRTKQLNMDPFDLLLRQYFLYMLNTIQSRLKSTVPRLYRRRALRVLHRLLNLLVESDNSVQKKSGDAKGGTNGKQRLRGSNSIALTNQHNSGILGQYFAPIFVTLKKAIQDSAVQTEAARTWQYFVGQLNNETAQKHLNAIVVSLLPCLEIGHASARVHVVKTLESLIAERRWEEDFDGLSTLPLSPLLLKSSEKIENVLHAATKDINLERRLGGIIELLFHDSPTVRLTALREIKRVLSEDVFKTDANGIHGWLGLSNTNIDISNIALRLLRALFTVAQRSSDIETKLACAECLGQIGAIDPSRLQDKRVTTYQQDMNKGDFEAKRFFVAHLISHCLVKALHAAPNTAVHDCVAYSIQEALKIMAKELVIPIDTKRTTFEFPDSLAKCFKEYETVEIVRPYWTTNLVLQNTDVQSEGPFYPRSSTFEGWLGVWTRYLISRSKGPLSDVFEICRTAIMKRTTESTKHTAMFLLPHLIHDALSYGDDEDYQNLREELLFVVRPVGQDRQMNARVHGSGSAKSKRKKSLSSNKRVLSAQAIFSLIDNLSTWRTTQSNDRYLHEKKVRKYKRSNKKAVIEEKFSLAPKRGIERCQDLLDSIPNKELSYLALDCKAYARALLYFERHLRETRDKNGYGISVGANCIDIDDLSGKFLPPFHLDEVSYVRKIYANIDEPDGMRGLMSVRSKILLMRSERSQSVSLQPTNDLQEKIIDHEYEQQWNEALTCYQQVLKQLPQPINDVEGVLPRGEIAGQAIDLRRDGTITRSDTLLREQTRRRNLNEERLALIGNMNSGILSCLLKVGHYETLLHHAIGVMRQDKNLVSSIAPLSIEAAWRLGKWEMLDNLLAETETISSNTFEYQIGATFSAMHKKDGVDFCSNIQAARMNVMGALSAASMESYERSYPMLLRLHALHEIEQAFSILCPDQVLSDYTFQSTDSKKGKLQGSQQLSGPSTVSLSDTDKLALLQKWEWNERLEVTRPSARLLEPLFAMRRVAYQMNRPSLSIREGEEWIKLAEVSRASGNLQGATIALMHAEQLNIPNARIENAKLLYRQGKLDTALNVLDPGEVAVSNLLKRDKASTEQRRHDVGQRLLLIAKWKQEAGLEAGEAIQNLFMNVTKLSPAWSKGYFQLGKYFDFLYETEKTNLSKTNVQKRLYPRPKSKTDTDFRRLVQQIILSELDLYTDKGRHIIHNYGRALRRGSDCLHQALPRLLTVWFEWANRFHKSLEILGAHIGDNDAGNGPDGSKSGKTSRSRSRQLAAASSARSNTTKNKRDKTIMGMVEKKFRELAQQLTTLSIPLYQWMAVFPQLVSRLGHENNVVAKALHTVIVKLVRAYPQQLMWTIVGITNMRNLPENVRRAQRARKVLEDVVSNPSGDPKTVQKFKGSKLKQIWDQTHDCCRILIDLARHRIQQTDSNTEEITYKAFGQNLSKFRLLVPTQFQLTVVLPRATMFSSKTQSGGRTQIENSNYHGFSDQPVTITKFYPTIEVMKSKEQPKKIKLLGSNGTVYTFLCKLEKKGDLRKDSIMMETFQLTNRLLQSDPEGRRRKLRMRTYAVTCLNESVGILEWVNNTSGFRYVMQQLYDYLQVKKSDGSPLQFRTTSAVQAEMVEIQGMLNAQKQIARYRRTVLKTFAPKMNKWFSLQFPVPTQWFEARLRFSRSCAVWSMLGHIVGLGDRHAENILLDTTTGECVHVDFDCIFDKGLNLSVPEVVPFRLTPHFVDGMGVTGYEGVYRASCEITLKVLRENKDQIISVLEAFLHSPLVDWKRHKIATADGNFNQNALEVLERTKKRLNGVYNYDSVTAAEKAKAYRSGVKYEKKNIRRELSDNKIPLSIEGQVQKLIHEATDEKNLVNMYCGWMPFA